MKINSIEARISIIIADGIVTITTQMDEDGADKHSLLELLEFKWA